MLESVTKEFKSVLTLHYDETDPALVKPVRWCQRNIVNMFRITSETFIERTLEKVQKVFMGFISILALPVAYPLAFVGVSIKLIRGATTAPLQDSPFEINHQKLANENLKTKSKEVLDRDWNLSRYFGHVRVMNLPWDEESFQKITDPEERRKRVEDNKARWQIVTESLREVGCNSYERFSSVVGINLPERLWRRMDHNYKNFDRSTPEGQKKFEGLSKGQTGCYMSHYRIVKEANENWEQAKADYAQIQSQIDTPSNESDLAVLNQKLVEAQERIKKYSSVLILEDDNRFGRVLDPVKKTYTLEKVGRVFHKAMSELPLNYEIFFLAACPSHLEAVAHTPHIRKFLDGVELNAYAVHSRFYKTLILQLEKIETEEGPLTAVDKEIPKTMPEAHVFMSAPPVAFQGGFKSSLSQDEKPEPFRQWMNGDWNNSLLTAV